MLILSVVFNWINLPAGAAAAPSIKGALEGFKEKDTDQLKLLWEYALHSDEIFNDLQNFFLFLESILLGGTFAIIAATTQKHNGLLNLVLTSVAFLGSLLVIYPG